VASSPALRPGVSVVIPVKDRARLLAQTLRSVREQSRPVDEIIVVDDGSVDDSEAVARDAGATVIPGEVDRRGPAAARNRGLDRVRTEFACPVDSDDLLLPGAIEKLTDALAGRPKAPFAFGRALVAAREPDGWHTEGIVAPLEEEMESLPCRLYARNFVPASSVVMRTQGILEVGGYPAWLDFDEDHYAWIQLARRASPVHVPEVLTVARRHAGNRHDPLALPAAREIAQLADEDPRLLACRPDRIGIQFVNRATSALRAHHPYAAARLAWDLLVRQPERRRTVKSAFHWWRIRRIRAREGKELWRADRELRQLLATYE
jgi:glycosyltransferase involved in cell wall biosynthesis